MKTMVRERGWWTMAVAAAALLAGAGVAAQQPDMVARKQAVEIAARMPFEKPIKGAPYSADTVVEGTQTLADGNRITNRTTGRVYRDGEGRIRREDERTFSVLAGADVKTAKMASVSILDPIAGVAYTLDPEHQIAWKTPASASGSIMGKIEATQVEGVRQKLMLERSMARGAERSPAGGGAGVPAPGARGNVGVDRERAPLEHRTIEGLAVEGRKTTTVIPAGAIGNDLPITVTSEEWSSPELKVLVMTHHSDPRTGDSTYRLTNIIRAEPDPSLFQVPPGYTVKETGISKLEPTARR